MKDIKEIISELLAKHILIEKDKIKNLIEIPPDQKLGDYAFPCFSLAKDFKKSPISIATELAVEISDQLPKEISEIKAINGYLNFFIDKKIFFKDTVLKILNEKENYGKIKERKREKIMVEFSQANTHKAFHVGHIRGTSLGESISRILEFSGNKVIRANYQGDTGMHVAKWLWCYKRFHFNEKLREDESWIASIYVEAVKKLAENPQLQIEVDEINKKLTEGNDKEIMSLWKKTREFSLNSLEKIYKDLITHFDKYFFESEIEKRGKEIAEGLLKEGFAKISDGATIIDLKQYNLGVLVLLRKDGTVLYSAKDLALAEKKFEIKGLTKSLSVIGSAQSFYTAQLSKILELTKFPYAKDYIFLHFSEVRLPTGKMSSRTGENILYSDFKREIINYAKEEIKKRFPKIGVKELEKRSLSISIAAIKYAMLKQDPNKVIIFNKEEALNFEGNSGPYLQYSYARANSIIKKSKTKPSEKFEIISLHEKEIQLVKKLAEFPEVVEHSKRQLNPALIANYSFQLSKIFNE
ncbi:MAG: arginine--tRNA ligase, partial [Candidatus Pacearchaeota archaeon]